LTALSQCVTLPDMEQLAQHIEANPGRTYAEWAGMFGISRPHLHALLSGERKPSPHVALRIQDVTGIPMTAWPNVAALAKVMGRGVE
jgi:plasmid maintenance system antidote protein VapI